MEQGPVASKAGPVPGRVKPLILNELGSIITILVAELDLHGTYTVFEPLGERFPAKLLILNDLPRCIKSLHECV